MTEQTTWTHRTHNSLKQLETYEADEGDAFMKMGKTGIKS